MTVELEEDRASGRRDSEMQLSSLENSNLKDSICQDVRVSIRVNAEAYVQVLTANARPRAE